MPPIPKINKEDILNGAFSMIKAEGIEGLNARSLAKVLHCSTQPIFKHFKNMEDLKEQVKHKIDKAYQQFIEERINREDHLFSMSVAYIEFAKEERYFFGALFVYPLIQTRRIEEVLNSSWNLETISDTQKQYTLAELQAENLYRDVRFYSHGIASQLYAQTIILTKGEIEELIRNAIDRFK